MSLMPHNPADVIDSPIWDTLIPSRPKLPNDIDDYDDNENEEMRRLVKNSHRAL